MSVIPSVNITLNAATIVITVIVFVLNFRKTSGDKRFRYIAIALILQLLTQCEALYLDCTFFTSDVNAEILTYFIIIGLLRIGILSLIIMCIVIESDGKPRLFKKKEPVTIPIMLAAFLPIITALIFQIMRFPVRLFGFSLSLSLLAICDLSEYHRFKEISDKEQILDIRQAKIMAEQIQPHFIYNSLMSIEYLIYTDPEHAAKCLEDFTEYLRGNIDALTSEEPIRFSKELEHIKQYAALERASREIPFELEVDLKADDFLIPPLTVQPIVENAIKHGALSRSDGSGKVIISTEAFGEYVKITIEDNGNGTGITEKQENHRSVGIANVRTRLEKQYGGILNITGSSNGTKAVITIPNKRRIG